MRHLLRTAAAIVATLALLLGAALAEDALELRSRAGASFRGRIVGSDETHLRLRSTDGAELRLAWKDLDERSWFNAKRSVTAPTDAAGLLALGEFAAAQGWRADAEPLVAAARKLDPSLAARADALGPRLDELRRTDAQALFDRGQEEVGRQRYLHALGRFRDARALAPKDARYVNAIGEAFYYLRRLRECRTHVEEALALDPAQKDAVFNLAQLDLLELDFESSLAGFRKVLALPVETGRFATAEEVLAKAKAEGVTSPDEAFRRFADGAAMQAKQIEPMLAGIVAGPGFAKEFRAETEHYVVRTGVSQEMADLVARRLELIYAEYDRRFGWSKTGESKTRGRETKFPVLVFTDKPEYVKWFGRVLQDERFGAMTGGVYVPAVKHLVFFQYPEFRDTQLVAWHEGFHQYLDHYVAGAPHWFNEGSAEYFGGSVLPEGRKRVVVGATNPWRVKHLGALVAASRVPDAHWFMQTDARTYMRLKPEPEQGRNGATTVGDHYALGWALVHFLQEGEGGKWQAKYTEHFKLLCDGMSHEDAFEKVWGRTDWPKFQQAWLRHCEWLVARGEAEEQGRPVPPMPK